MSTLTREFSIDGMHCANCEVLIERRFKKIAGVRRVKVSHITGQAEINCYGDLDLTALQRAIADDGYTVSRLNEQGRKPSGTKGAQNTARDRIEIGAAFLILVGGLLACCNKPARTYEPLKSPCRHKLYLRNPVPD